MNFDIVYGRQIGISTKLECIGDLLVSSCLGIRYLLVSSCLGLGEFFSHLVSMLSEFAFKFAFEDVGQLSEHGGEGIDVGNGIGDGISRDRRLGHVHLGWDTVWNGFIFRVFACCEG